MARKCQLQTVDSRSWTRIWDCYFSDCAVALLLPTDTWIALRLRLVTELRSNPRLHLGLCRSVLWVRPVSYFYVFLKELWQLIWSSKGESEHNRWSGDNDCLWFTRLTVELGARCTTLHHERLSWTRLRHSHPIGESKVCYLFWWAAGLPLNLNRLPVTRLSTCVRSLPSPQVRYISGTKVPYWIAAWNGDG